MTSEILSLHNLHYNPELGAFEALARTEANGVIYTHWVHVKAPPQSDFTRISRGLVDRARLAHRQARRARRPDRPTSRFDLPRAA